MLKTTVRDNAIAFGEDFALSFQRTLRIPDDNKTYPLPPGLGVFPVCRVEDYRDSVPASWLEHGGVFIPMYQREALWISFDSCDYKPNAIKIAVGKINAVSGKPWHQRLERSTKQKRRKKKTYTAESDYLVAPPQPWLDGINAGDNYIKQFVAMPLGMGYTVEGQITGKEEFGGIQIIVYEPKAGKFSKPKASRHHIDFMEMEQERVMPKSASAAGEMGIAAGGRMKQKIYADRYGIDTWDENNYGRVYVHIINSMMYRQITGLEPPQTPVTAKTYAQYQLPWFDLYDETMSDIAPPSELISVKSVREMDEQKQLGVQQDDDSVDTHHLINYSLEKSQNIEDGNW